MCSQGWYIPVVQVHRPSSRHTLQSQLISLDSPVQRASRGPETKDTPEREIGVAINLDIDYALKRNNNEVHEKDNNDKLTLLVTVEEVGCEVKWDVK